MSNIEVGYFIRTENGSIGIIKHKTTVYENDKFVRNEYRTSFNPYYYTDKQMEECRWKIAKNIIDLIEKGDYVNGMRIIATENRGRFNEEKQKNEKVILAENYDEWTDNGVISNEDIKTIVTKEQFKEMEYRI